MNPGKSIVLYARVSSAHQAQQATIASQIAALQERAQADGFLVLPSDLYVDDGYSGTTLVRPALERLRDRAAEGRVDRLYVHSPDRIARRYAYQVLLLEELSKHGVEVVFLNGPSSRSAEDELLVQVQGIIAEYERARLLERCRRGRIHKARSGIINALAHAPYGYLYVHKTDREPARYQVVLHEAKVVRSIFQWLVEEQVPINELARRLNVQGVPTRTGRAGWDRNTIWNMLRNPAYMGQAAFGKTEAAEPIRTRRPPMGRTVPQRNLKSSQHFKPQQEWISIPVPPILSSDLFAAAQEQLQRNRQLAQRHARGERYLLQGLLGCARCGHAFCGCTRSKTPQVSYYKCWRGMRYRLVDAKHCANPPVRADKLDHYVWESVCAVLRDPARLIEEWSRRSGDDGAAAELHTQREEAQRFLAAQEQTLRRLRDAYEVGALELDELNARTERVRTRIARARQEFEQIESSLAETIEIKAVVTQLQSFADQVRDGLDRLDWSQRRQLIRTLVARVEIDQDAATIVYRLPGRSPAPPSAPTGDGSADARGSIAFEPPAQPFSTSASPQSGSERAARFIALRTRRPLGARLLARSRARPASLACVAAGPAPDPRAPAPWP